MITTNMKYYILIFLLTISAISRGQARIVLNNNVNIVLNGGSDSPPIYVVQANGNANAVEFAGTGGNIRSENEYNKLRWRIGTNTGVYTIPFTTASGVKIPLEMNVTGAGVGGTHLDFSTYGTPTDKLDPDDVTPSMVTNLQRASDGAPNNSQGIIDRFWIIDAMNYTTRPNVTLSFGYDPDEVNGSDVAVGAMVAQRFNTIEESWTGSYGNDDGVDKVHSVVVEGPQLFEAWTLSSESSLLPVQLLLFNATCEDQQVVLNWQTASETNSLFFQVEKSTNGFDWVAVGQVDAQGNSSTTSSYQLIDPVKVRTVTYYRLRQVDSDGAEELFSVQSVQACAENQNQVLVISDNTGNYQVSILLDQDEIIHADLVEMTGKKVRATRKLDAVKGDNVFIFNEQDLATGIYLLRLTGESTKYTHKLLIQK